MISTRDRDQVQIDLSRFIGEMKREGITTLVPHPEDIPDRIELIGLLSGRRPNLYELLLGKAEQDGWVALTKGENPDLKTMDAARFIQTNATSLDGKRAEQIVEMVKTESQPAEKSILDMLRKGR